MVPAEASPSFFAANDPARARIGHSWGWIWRSNPNSLPSSRRHKPVIMSVPLASGALAF
jgi:hypothetical protein